MCVCVCVWVCVHLEPVMAQDLKITFQGSNGTLTWTAPQTAPTTRFRVKYVGRFWNHHETFNRTGGKTSVGPLRPGTQYLFQVITVSGTMESEPANCTEYTRESAGKHARTHARTHQHIEFDVVYFIQTLLFLF